MKQLLSHPLKHFTGPSPAVVESLIVLRKYRAGNGDTAAALRALRHVERTYGYPLQVATSLFSHVLNINDKDTKKQILFESLDHIIDWIFYHPIKAGLWKMFYSAISQIRTAAFSTADAKMRQDKMRWA